METNSNLIKKLYNSIKSNSCANPDCVEEIEKLELIINCYNNQIIPIDIELINILLINKN